MVFLKSDVSENVSPPSSGKKIPQAKKKFRGSYNGGKGNTFFRNVGFYNIHRRNIPADDRVDIDLLKIIIISIWV
jgi:hypothetical protein